MALMSADDRAAASAPAAPALHKPVERDQQAAHQHRADERTQSWLVTLWLECESRIDGAVEPPARAVVGGTTSGRTVGRAVGGIVGGIEGEAHVGASHRLLRRELPNHGQLLDEATTTFAPVCAPADAPNARTLAAPTAFRRFSSRIDTAQKSRFDATDELQILERNEQSREDG
jgi:hypothetical protein